MRTWKAGTWMMVWAVFTTGCETDGVGPAAGPTDAEPRAIALVSGDGQEGKAGEILDEPLIVRVTGPEGQALADVRVRWQIVTGTGVLRMAPTVTGSGELVSHTNADGLARAYVEPLKLGAFEVRARLVSGGGQSVTFTAEVWTLVISILEGWGFCAANGFWCQPVPIPVGTVVEWVNRDAQQHTVTSSSAPPGGTPFDSGTLRPGDRFRFMVDVPGTWEYFDRVLGADVLASTLTAQ